MLQELRNRDEVYQLCVFQVQAATTTHSRVAINFHAWTCVTMLDVAVGHAAT